MASTSAVQQVVQALNVLYQDPNPAAKETANAWLSDFQKSNEAWATSQLILFAPDAPIEPKLFAAQTFRSKIIYDLDSLPAAHRLPLRDSLLTALRTFAAGPRVILSQIALALADLALQLTSQEWNDPTSAMIELFAKEPEMAGALLEWLGAMAEEFNGNMKLDVKNDFGRGAEKAMADSVVGLLSMYVQAPGITTTLHNQCFGCLASWLRTGQASASSLVGTPLLASAFASLSSPPLFDSAVDCLVDIIHESQELNDHMALIEEIVPRLITLKSVLALPSTLEDSEQMRGYCRIFVEAGEWYESLMVQHVATFLPLVEAIAECSAYVDLDVVGITLNFWYKLARRVRNQREDPAVQPLAAVFSNLVEIIIRHLHYPDDSTALVGQERDDFKSFRHQIGDTLKDCCAVLTATRCLRRSYDIIASSLAQALATGGEPKWQDIEAPLFSMRSMGAEVDPRDDDIMPEIMDILPKLPPHPKIRYAAILVIGRYTNWIECHPEHIQFQLPYITSGLEGSDYEVSAAAAQALKFLCKDCAHHLVPYLPQLHTFFQTVVTTLGSEDLLDITAAIAHIIAVMPLEEAAAALQLFCMPNIETLHAITSSPTEATKADLRTACDALERLDMLLAVVGPFPPPGLPPSCQSTCAQIWPILDAFIAKYGQQRIVSEKVCICIRRGLQFFGEAAFSIAPAVLERMAVAFESSASSSYLWITAKLVPSFARRKDPSFDAALKNVVERESAKIFDMLQRTTPAQLGDVLEDYVRLLYDLIEYSPELILPSSLFAPAFQAILTTLTLEMPTIVLAALDALRSILGHEALSFTPTDPNPPPIAALYPTFSTAIRTVVAGSAEQLVGLLLNGLVTFSEDTTSSILTLFRVLSIHFPAVLATALPAAVENLPVKIASKEEKLEFINKYTLAHGAQNPNNVKDAFTWLLRTSKKSRERAEHLERT